MPVVADVSAERLFALISVAAVGGVRIEDRVRTVTELAIACAVGEPELVVLHIALFCMLLGTACLTLPPGLLSSTLGHAVGFSDYLSLAWLLASIATIGGALGSGLEDDRVVTEAAYGVRQRQRIEETQARSNDPE